MVASTSTTPPAKARRKFARASIDEHVSACAPAVRMVVLHAWACWDDGNPDDPTVGHRVLPVAAVRTFRTTRYSKDVDRDAYPPIPATHAQARRDGWALNYSTLDSDALVVDDETGELVGARDEMNGCNVVNRVVACP